MRLNLLINGMLAGITTMLLVVFLTTNEFTYISASGRKFIIMGWLRAVVIIAFVGVDACAIWPFVFGK